MSLVLRDRTTSRAITGAAVRWGTRTMPDVVFIPLMLVTVSLVAAMSFATQPTAMATAAWWPNAGIGLGLALRYPRRYAWALAVGVSAMTLPVMLWVGRPVGLSIALAAISALEMILAVVLLRGRRDELPTLSNPRDLGRLLAVVTIAGAVYAVAAAGSSLLLGDPVGAWTRLVTAMPKHAAGMLLLTPLFMKLPARPRRAGYAEVVVQVVTTLALAVVTFTISSPPLSFLVFVPLIWAALRMSTRALLLEMLCIAVIASVGSAYGRGPFSFARVGPEVGTVALQVFQVSMALVFLALALSLGGERETALRLHASEELFRKSFNSSVAGKLMVTRAATEWTVRQSNAAARELFPGLEDGIVGLVDLLGRDATGSLSVAADTLVEGNTRLTLTLGDGRSIYISMAAITEQADGMLFALHFHDVTEVLRARQLEQEELERAAEMQRALLPGRQPDIPGWTCATVSAPARQVGGDFYDLRQDWPQMVVSLGDVMGKGVGAGMLAAATRAALRCDRPDTNPSEVITHASRTLSDDLHHAHAFVTLAYVLVQLDRGEFSLTDAGHGLCFVVRAGNRGVERLASSDLPMGVGEYWHEITGVLDPGDSLLLVSDGLLERWGGRLDGLQDTIIRYAKRHEGNPQAFVDALCGGDNDSADRADRDDLTAVAIQRDRPPAVSSPLA